MSLAFRMLKYLVKSWLSGSLSRLPSEDDDSLALIFFNVLPPTLPPPPPAELLLVSGPVVVDPLPRLLEEVG